ncbi:MAG: leucine-rich repeat protein, partial [Oscillospiraceae bacterium]|nr:leucine-rich repeat protein [Oscillospiraceae bacterium]
LTLENVTSIHYKAFKGCAMLKSVTIPDSVTEILGYSYSGDCGAFQGCTNLKTVTFGKKLNTIGKEAFKGCTSLTAIDIPDNVTAIEVNAFSGTSLNSATVRSKICTIADGKMTLPVTQDGTIYGLADSYVQQYAETNGYTFALAGDQPVTPPVSSGEDAYDAGDLDGNGVVNSMDAAIILQYAAEAGAGSFTGTMTEYLKEKGYRS